VLLAASFWLRPVISGCIACGGEGFECDAGVIDNDMKRMSPMHLCCMGRAFGPVNGTPGRPPLLNPCKAVTRDQLFS
jgi:hypothetical protein